MQFSIIQPLTYTDLPDDSQGRQINIKEVYLKKSVEICGNKI